MDTLRKHWIAGSGMHGCLFDSCEVYGTREDAVNALADIFQLERTRKATLRRDGLLELCPRDGAQYCEVTACTCSNPACHSDSGIG